MDLIQIREMKPTDAADILAIYTAGIASRNATFETQTPPWEKWDAKHHPFCRLVATAADQVLGWAALAPVSNRECYAGVAEISVYISLEAQGRGVGSRLMGQIIQDSESAGIWSLYASMFPENTASRILHSKFGFREIGFREKIAKLDGVWRDTLLMERRSTVIGR